MIFYGLPDCLLDVFRSRLRVWITVTMLESFAAAAGAKSVTGPPIDYRLLLLRRDEVGLIGV